MNTFISKSNSKKTNENYFEKCERVKKIFEKVKI